VFLQSAVSGWNSFVRYRLCAVAMAVTAQAAAATSHKRCRFT
jgi:hypothetical protein